MATEEVVGLDFIADESKVCHKGLHAFKTAFSER